ncbi:MAG: DUF1080 domain-containing protein [Chthoniobacter sp.]|nr:DUF1080 domain-containing protein [Chthoniobacter sp.]
MKSIVCLALACLLTMLAAEKGVAADEQSLLGKPGKLLLEDDFSRTEMAPKWKIGMGFFTIKDGVVTAAENPADKHGAYAYVDPHFPYKDFVAGFSVKFDGGKSCSFRMDDTDYQGSHAGHIIRATITPTSVQLDDSKFGSMKTDLYEKMKDPSTTAEEKKQVQAAMKARAASFKVDLDLAKWHQARVEVVGDEMLLSIDGKPVGYLQSEGVDHPTKNAVGFTIGGQSVQLDNVRVWEATAAPSWAIHRPEVLGSMQKIP